MAIEVKHICDKCKCEVINNDMYRKPQGWNEVSFKIGDYTKKTFTLCKECQIKLGIIKESGIKTNFHEEPNAFEELLDKIAELVAERIEG